MKRHRLLLVVCSTAFCALVLSGLNAAVASGGLGADFNNDNSVDNLDLAKWNADYGSISSPSGPSFLAWQSEIASSSNQQAEVAHNPEPATLVVWGTLAAVAGLGIAARRRRDLMSAVSDS